MLFFYNGDSLKSGIYEIRNRYSNRSYIGQAKEFKERWQSGHKHSLRNQTSKKTNKFLQNDYNKCKEIFGHDDFLEFHIIEIIDNSTREQRVKRENYWKKKYNKAGYKLYSKEEPIKSEGPWSNNPEETRKKLREQKLGEKNPMYGKPSWNKGKKQPEISGENHPMYGKKHSQESKQKMSESHIGIQAGEKHPFYGKHRSEEIRAKISVAQKGKQSNRKGAKMTLKSIQKRLETIEKNGGFLKAMNHPNTKIYENIILQAPDGTIYTKIECLAEFCRNHNLHTSAVCMMLSRKQKTHRGWKIVSN